MGRETLPAEYGGEGSAERFPTQLDAKAEGLATPRGDDAEVEIS